MSIESAGLFGVLQVIFCNRTSREQGGVGVGLFFAGAVGLIGFVWRAGWVITLKMRFIGFVWKWKREEKKEERVGIGFDLRDRGLEGEAIGRGAA
jgi:hypothetical protein